MRIYIGLAASLALAIAPTTGALAGESAAPVLSDSRADRTDLPIGVEPWWPSRYGADDQIGDRFYN